MKKFALASVALLSVAGALNAQNYLIDNPDNKPYIGIRAGLDISSTAGQAENVFGNGAGFTIGGVYNIPLWKNLYFEPGLSLFYDTFDATIYDRSEIDPSMIVEIDGSIRNFGFRVPLNFGYHFDFTDDISIQLFTGPVLNLNVTARQHFPGESESIMNDGFKRFDAQWDFGVGMNYSQHYYVAISGGVGMTKAFKVPGDSFRRNTFNITFGYNF